MAAVWTDASKFAAWREVELAVLEVREDLKQVPEGTTQHCAAWTGVDGEVGAAIVRRDEERLHHDLNAFVEVMRAQMIARRRFPDGLILRRDAEDFHGLLDGLLAEQGDCPEASLFHDGMTSYDTEEPATALLFRRASNVILGETGKLEAALVARAKKHRGLVMMGRTHGQHAQPVTFGVKCLNWLEGVQLARQRFAQAAEEAQVMKLSGAVGMYGTLGPEVEEAVAKRLALVPPRAATQIVGLGRRAAVVSALAALATEAEKVARDLWLLAQSEIGEVREPFGKMQKGSSAMPHKKNPITLEQCFGLPRLIRAYAQALLEDVATANERDISHSSVERIAVPDAFGLTDHLLRRLTGVIERLEVFPDRMRENLERGHGTFASQAVEMTLKRLGVPAEIAYRVVQEASAVAIRERKHLGRILLGMTQLHERQGVEDSLLACFKEEAWVAHESAIYARFASVLKP